MSQPAVVILGGGILGCALAWRLAERGAYPGGSIALVDPHPIASQATSRAAGLLSLSRPSAKAQWIPLTRTTLRAIEALGKEGFPVPLYRCGALFLATSPAARRALADHEATAASSDIPCERHAPGRFASRLPWINADRFAEALWFPDEAYTDPYLLASAYANAARRLGVRVLTGVPTRLVSEGRRVAVETGGERLQPASVWLASGAWSAELLRPLEIQVPQAAVRSHYWITAPTSSAPSDMPIVLAPDIRLYARREIGAILFGLREAQGVAVSGKGLPADLGEFVFDASDRSGHATLEMYASALARFAPGLMRTGLAHYVAGPSCYTPDGDFVVGRIPEWTNLCLLTGCNGAGIAVSAGLADVAVDCELGREGEALARYAPSRFGTFDADTPEWIARCIAARAGKTSG